MSTAMEVFLRIGQVGEATGVDPTVLRAWEKRYGVPAADRTSGGQRRYAPHEVDRVKAMKRLIDGGFRAAEAARTVSASFPLDRTGEVGLQHSKDDLADLLVTGDPGAMRILDRLAQDQPQEDVIEDLIAPIMREVGDRWASGAIGIAEEHAATWLVASWIGAQVRSMPPPLRPQVIVTATPPGERHDLGVAMLGVFLRRQGLPVLHLGSDLPAYEIAAKAAAASASVVVLGVLTPGLESELQATIAAIAEAAPGVAIGVGGAASATMTVPDPAVKLPGNMRAAAQALVEMAAGVPQRS